MYINPNHKFFQFGNKQLYCFGGSIGTAYISYETPIAIKCNGSLYATKSKYSVTTSRHMSFVLKHNNWDKDYVVYVDQSRIDKAYHMISSNIYTVSECEAVLNGEDK